ncbi:transposase, partial [Variovorax sp. CAN2819]
MGAPSYDPGDLLWLYIWGYLSAIRSSRALEREGHRNLECMWLLVRLAPDHKTIAEFRRRNTAALVASCAAFVPFASDSRLTRGASVAVDGSKAQAVASREAVVGQRELAAQAQRNAQEIATYLRWLDSRERDDEQGGQGPGGGAGAPDEVRAAKERLKTEGRAIATQAQHHQDGGGLYQPGAFVCEAASDSFTCPASSALRRKQLSRKDKTVIYAAQPGDCARCARKPGGTTARRRFATRHLHEEALEADTSRLAAKPWMMALRRQTVEPLFASVKHLILGNARLRMRHLTGAQAEFALAVMAYNLKRVLNMKGHPRCAPGAAGPRHGGLSHDARHAQEARQPHHHVALQPQPRERGVDDGVPCARGRHHRM